MDERKTGNESRAFASAGTDALTGLVGTATVLGAGSGTGARISAIPESALVSLSMGLLATTGLGGSGAEFSGSPAGRGAGSAHGSVRAVGG